MPPERLRSERTVSSLLNRGVLFAFAAALLFGAGTVAAKWIVGPVSPWLLAGVLYLGSGLGLAIWRLMDRAALPRLNHGDTLWLAGAMVSGGIIAPVLLMWGLAQMPASGASLLLNLEGVLTVLLAWFAFRENFDRRIALGMVLIVAGTVVLSWPGRTSLESVWPALAVVGACLGWAIDNNLTRKVALSDATFIAMSKGLVAGGVNVTVALSLGAIVPSAGLIAAGALTGLLSYGISLVCFVLALRELGAARTSAYFSAAPFVGALLAIPLLGERLTWQIAVAAGLMAWGVWLHLTEHHSHTHTHEELEHEHEHVHDDHHQHDHPEPVAPGTRHSHRHRHPRMTHSHAHYPDAHHRHEH
jgi:drug/metabolite transporter (DMT)-like permease